MKRSHQQEHASMEMHGACRGGTLGQRRTIARRGHQSGGSGDGSGASWKSGCPGGWLGVSEERESVMKPWRLTALRQMDTSTCDARRGHESSDAKRAPTHAVDIMEGSRAARDGGCGRREAGVEEDPVRKHAWHWRV